ncbi:MAG: hypothetical protein ACTSWN_14215 [Promethearchaeota archaeon]
MVKQEYLQFLGFISSIRRLIFIVAVLGGYDGPTEMDQKSGNHDSF